MPFYEYQIQMPGPLQDVYDSLIDQLDRSQNDQRNIIPGCQHAIVLIKTSIDLLKKYVLTNPFNNKEDEIAFFKFIKPKFYSQYIYYLKVFRIETYRPNGSIESEQAYLYKELGRLQEFYDVNREFYAYYRSGSNYLDEKHFIRGSVDSSLALGSHQLDGDPTFCTTHDYTVAKILANERIREYLLDSLHRFTHKERATTSQTAPLPDLTWTATLAAINELIYGLKASGAINNGNVSVIDIAEGLGILFKVKIGNIYRRQQENRLRENKAPFLEFVKKKYIEDMNRTDENPHPSTK